MYVFYRFRPKGTLQVQRLANLIILNANTMHMMKLNYLFLYDEIWIIFCIGFCVCLYPSWNIFIHTETSPLTMNSQYLYRSKHNTAVFIRKKRHLLYFLSIGVLFPCINREARGNSWHFNKFNYNLQQIKTCYLGTAAKVIIVACGSLVRIFYQQMISCRKTGFCKSQPIYPENLSWYQKFTEKELVMSCNPRWTGGNYQKKGGMSHMFI